MSTHSPFSGCLIGIIAISIVVVTICVAFWNLGKLDDAMQGFSESHPRSLPVTKRTGAELAAIIAPLQAQLDAIKASKPDYSKPDATANLSISAEQVRILMDSLPINAELSQVFELQSIQGDQLVLEVSIPIRNKPFSKEKFRYVNGIMTAQLHIDKLQPVLKASSIKTKEGEVNPGFLQHFQFYEFAKHLLEDEQLKPILPNITSIAIQDGHINFGVNLVEYHKLVAQLSPDAAKPVNTNSQRWVGLGFLVMVLFGFFYIRSLKKSKPLS